ncbi:hypothetical protein [Myxosarcina sp. GI1(2024)]
MTLLGPSVIDANGGDVGSESSFGGQASERKPKIHLTSGVANAMIATSRLNSPIISAHPQFPQFPQFLLGKLIYLQPSA